MRIPDETVIGVFDNRLLISFLADGHKLTAKLKTLAESKKLKDTIKQYRFAAPDQRLSDYDTHEKIIVTSAEGQYRGIVIW